jgi:short subunit dehydrogenase-like uncharacterized protein
VLREIDRRGGRAIPVGRDAAKLAPGGRVAAMDDPGSLDGALSGAAAVINCAGPFFDTALPVVDAALRARIPYLDVTAEQATAQAIHSERDAAAREAGVAVVPAMAFYGGLGDLLASAACGEWRAPDAIELAVALDSWHPTAGTRETGRRNTARRLIVRDGRLVPLPDPAPRQRWDFPAPFGTQEVVAVPLTETVLIARHIAARDVTAFMNLAPLDDLHDPDTPPPRAADASGRSTQRFLVEAVVRHGDETRRASAGGRDIYAVTAPLVVTAALRLMAGVGRAGVLAPGEAFAARAFLEALAPEPLALAFSS